MRLLRVTASVAMSMVIAGAWTLALPGVAAAVGTTNCSEGPGAVNHWRGEVVGGDQKHGTSGTVAARTLQICTGPSLIEIDGSFYFSNVEPNSGSFRDIVQIGFGQGRSPTIPGGMHFYAGFGRSTTTPGCSGLTNVDPLASAVGSYDNAQHDYKVYHEANVWKLLVGSTVKHTVSEAAVCWTPGRSTWFAETWDAGDQIGGTAASHLLVTSMNYAKAEGGGFFWTSLTAGQACNYNNAAPAVYRCNIPGATSIGLWTDDR